MLNLKNQGISIDPMPRRVGDKCRITYEGLLKKSGADQVYLHCGYGDKWNHVQDISMFNTETGSTCEIRMDQGEMFNYCFKDSADHWDNNHGRNWNIIMLS